MMKFDNIRPNIHDYINHEREFGKKKSKTDSPVVNVFNTSEIIEYKVT